MQAAKSAGSHVSMWNVGVLLLLGTASAAAVVRASAPTSTTSSLPLPPNLGMLQPLDPTLVATYLFTQRSRKFPCPHLRLLLLSRVMILKLK
jgi:hypothetical protein